MKCYVCGLEEAEGRHAQCPVCGFPFMKIVGDPREFEANISEMTKNYRNKRIGGTEVGLTLYSYRAKQERVLLEAEQDGILVHDLAVMKPGDEQWIDRDFYRPKGSEHKDIALDVYFEKDGKREKKKVPVHVPPMEGAWKVGLRLEPGFRVRFLVGDRGAAAESGDISVPFE